MGSPCVYVDIQLEIKPGTKKKFGRNKAIPYGAREPAALSIYAPLRRFHFKHRLRIRLIFTNRLVYGIFFNPLLADETEFNYFNPSHNYDFVFITVS